MAGSPKPACFPVPKGLGRVALGFNPGNVCISRLKPRRGDGKLAKAAVTPPGLAVTMLLLPGLKPGATRLSPFGALGPTQHVVLTWVKCIPRFRQYIAAFPAYTVLLGGGAAEENRKLRAAQGRMCRNPC